jgi:hypothetical protein
VKFKVGRVMKYAVDQSMHSTQEMPVVETATKAFATSQG